MSRVIKGNHRISGLNQNTKIYVVVQFYPWFKFYFLLFLGMVMYDNEFETKEIKFKPRIKPQHISVLKFAMIFCV